MSISCQYIDDAEVSLKLKALFPATFTDGYRALTAETLNVILTEWTTPFQSQMDYINSYISIFDVKKRIMELNLASQQAALIGDKTISPDHISSTLRFYGNLCQHLQESIEARLKHHRLADQPETDVPLLPRLRRLGQMCGSSSPKIRCTEKEQMALVYCVVAQTERFVFEISKDESVRSGTSYEHALIQWYCDMSPIDLTNFLRPNRLYVKQGLFNPDEDDPLRYSLSVPYTSVTILVGTTMEESERLKVADTVLAQILAQEGIATSAPEPPPEVTRISQR